MARDKYPCPIRDPDKTNFKIGDTILIKNHTPRDIFDLIYKPRLRIFKKILDKALDVQDSAGKVK